MKSLLGLLAHLAIPWSRAAWPRIATSIGGGERSRGWRSPDQDREHDDYTGGS